MRIVLAPARRMRPVEGVEATGRPEFIDRAASLAALLADRSAWELESLLRCNPELALEALGHYQAFDPQARGIPALLGYWGLCYGALGARDFTPQELAFAQERVRIVSALYGLLRPLDGVQPYRLEFTSRLRVKGETLYRFWGPRIADALFRDCDTAVCLSSSEYAKAVSRHLGPGRRWIEVVFLPCPGARRTVGSTHSKLARGGMARFAVRERLTRPEELRQFEGDGYHYVKEGSSAERYLFARDGPSPPFKLAFQLVHKSVEFFK